MTVARQHCGTSLRRQRVTASNVVVGGHRINGIDFVEVIDSEAPSAELRQRIIEVHFLKRNGISNAGAVLLGPENFAIEGGSRVSGIQVVAAEVGDEPEIVRLTLDQRGDFSPYTLSVRAGANVDTPPGFIDSQLANVTFAFKVECPSDFDCVEPDEQSRSRPFGPPIDYLTRDYEGFRRLMLDRMAVTTPGWEERNPADLGVMLVEALADASDRVSWFQDAVATEAYLGTARLRQSLHRHSRLLGYRPDNGCNARVAIAIEARSNHLSGGPAISAGSRFLTSPAQSATMPPVVLPRDPVTFEALLGQGAIVFEAIEPLETLRTSRNAMRIHDWGDEACCLPAGSTEAWLVREGPPLGLTVGDLLIFEELIPFGGAPGDFADREHRQIVRLKEVETGLRDAVMGVDLVRIAWHAEDALLFPLNLQGDASDPGAVAIGNVVIADEGRTVDFGQDPATAREDAIAIEMAGNGGVAEDDGPGHAMRLRLASDRLVHAIPHDGEQAREHSAQNIFAGIQEPIASAALTGEGQTWQSQPDLLSSDRFAANFVVEPREGGGHYARFGDNVLGREPSPGASFTARLRLGGGGKGNVSADSIHHIIADDGSKIAGIRNPLPATGGREPESKQRIRIAAPHAFRSQRRAVTAQDYADAAAQHPSVVRAFARRRWTGSWYTISLAVDLLGGAQVDSAFANDLKRFLEDRRLAGHDLRIIDPVFVSLDIALFVCVRPEFYAPDIERELLSIFSSQALGDGALGYFHPDKLGFGEDLALSPIIARGMQVEGVQWIGMSDHDGNRVGRFRRMDQPDFDHDETGVIPIAEGEIARLQNDLNYPDHGVLRFHVEGGR